MMRSPQSPRCDVIPFVTTFSLPDRYAQNMKHCSILFGCDWGGTLCRIVILTRRLSMRDGGLRELYRHGAQDQQSSEGLLDSAFSGLAERCSV